MKTLIVAHYWYPYNNAGTFRWVNFSQEFDCDILTTKVPVNSFYDDTIPNPRKNTIRFGNKLPAVVWGFLASFVMLFKRYDRYIITSPPESLLLGAWLLQLLGKRVFVDMRDTINRKSQPHKFLIPIYKFMYKRIKNVTVAWKFFDEKPCVYHGYEEVDKHEFVEYYKGRTNHAMYLKMLSLGLMPDQSNKPSGYAASSIHTFNHLGYPVNGDMHEEAKTAVCGSCAEQAKLIKSIYDTSTNSLR